MASSLTSLGGYLTSTDQNPFTGKILIQGYSLGGRTSQLKKLNLGLGSHPYVYVQQRIWVETSQTQENQGKTV